MGREEEERLGRFFPAPTFPGHSVQLLCILSDLLLVSVICYRVTNHP